MQVNKLVTYFKESASELQKVVWPTRKETLLYTALVIIISLAVAVFIGLADFTLNFGVEQIIK